MTPTELTNVTALSATLTKLVGVKGHAIAAGAKVTFNVTGPNGITAIVSAADLRAAMGNDAYDTLAADLLTSVQAALDTATTTAQIQFNAFTGTNTVST